MCQAVGCALVCEHKDSYEKSHILLSQNSGKTTTNICGTSLCSTCQISFGITMMISTKIISKYFQSIAKKKISKMGFGKNRKTYQKSTNIVNIVGSMKTVLSIALHLNKFQFDSKLNQA